ncbi:MAG: YlbF family regulator [Clostridia bacterium]|nr:YlbF family regulator [Clostridia bacterium]
MDIYTKARELAQAISQSEELKKMKDSEAAMMCDPEARKMVEEYQKIQMEALKNGLHFDQLPEEQQKKLEELDEKMSKNKHIVAYMEAQENLEQILRSVNLIITSALNDNDGACPSSGCAGCTSCN